MEYMKIYLASPIWLIAFCDYIAKDINDLVNYLKNQKIDTSINSAQVKINNKLI